MQTKLIVTALGAFGFGALASWAITADIHEKRLNFERTGYEELLSDKTDHIFHLKDRIEALEGFVTQSVSLRDVVENLEGHTSEKIGDAEEAFDEFKMVDPKDKIEQGDVEVLTDVEVESLSLDSEPNAFGETVEVGHEDKPDVPEGETPEETKTKLQGIIDAYTADPQVQNEFADIITNMDDYSKAAPFVISRDTYAYDEEGQYYSKITVNYYHRSRVVLDDDEDPMEDVANTIGWRNLNQFGGESGDPNVVFIRNHRLMTDFEVVREDGELPLHVKYGMGKDEFKLSRASGVLKLRPEDE